MTKFEYKGRKLKGTSEEIDYMNSDVLPLLSTIKILKWPSIFNIKSKMVSMISKHYKIEIPKLIPMNVI